MENIRKWISDTQPIAIPEYYSHFVGKDNINFEDEKYFLKYVDISKYTLDDIEKVPIEFQDYFIKSQIISMTREKYSKSYKCEKIYKYFNESFGSFKELSYSLKNIKHSLILEFLILENSEMIDYVLSQFYAEGLYSTFTKIIFEVYNKLDCRLFEHSSKDQRIEFAIIAKTHKNWNLISKNIFNKFGIELSHLNRSEQKPQKIQSIKELAYKFEKDPQNIKSLLYNKFACNLKSEYWLFVDCTSQRGWAPLLLE